MDWGYARLTFLDGFPVHLVGQVGKTNITILVLGETLQKLLSLLNENFFIPRSK